ncbi:hypothetical protein R6Q57_026576, partial [Mikania cordata]
LACSQSDGDDFEKAVQHVCHEADVSPKIAVIMAGNQLPSYIGSSSKLITV